MKFSKKNILIIFIFILFYLTLLIGFYINEDSAGGAIQDYKYHLRVKEFFLDSNIYGLKNYMETNAVHSPVFIIFFKYLSLFGNDLGRFLFVNISVLLPIFFYLSLNTKFKNHYILLFVLSNFFFLSPYFRSSAIWPGDENLALLFFSLSIYCYCSFINSNKELSKVILLILNITFLAVASYFRPTYSLFTILFFYEMVFKNFRLNYFYIYFFFSLILAFPAFYYIFIMDVKYFYHIIGSSHFINSFPLTYTVMFFYLFPFIILMFKSREKIIVFNFINFILTIILSLLVFIFFNYKPITGGGIIYIAQNKYFDGNIIFSLIFGICFYLTNQFLQINNFKNMIILIILLLFEIDFQFYMETYDPLFLICLFLLFDTKLISNFINNGFNKNLIFLYSYLVIFYLTKITNLYLI